jgi:hypothetical protein
MSYAELMVKRLLLWVALLAAGFAPLAQAVPCIMGDHAQIAAGGAGCITTHHAEGKADCAKSTVQDCFDLHALAPEATAVKAVAGQDIYAPAILPATVHPLALLGQKVTRPPPDIADRFTPTHEFLASLSRWLI